MMRYVISVTVITAVVLMTAGCGDDETPATGRASGKIDGALTQRADLRFEVANVGVAGDTFFVPIKNLVKQAAEDYGVKVNYRETQQFDVLELERLIRAAIAAKPDGIITGMVDRDALGPAVNAATEAGIPVVFVTAGVDELGKFPDVLGYVGAVDVETGRAGGERFRREGISNPICVNHQVGNTPLDDRCRGFEEGYGREVKQLAIDGEDPTASANRIKATLQGDASIDGIFTLGNTGAAAAIDAVADSRDGDITLATVDLSKQILEAVAGGKMLFALDQQQGLQGYEAVRTLVMFRQFGYVPAGRIERTGPAFITRENAKQVLALQDAGLR